MAWIYCFIKSVANNVEDNDTTLQMMGLTKTAGYSCKKVRMKIHIQMTVNLAI